METLPTMFDNLSDEPPSGGTKVEETTRDILSRFYQHQIFIKNVHFITKSYAIHKTTDSYLETFLSLSDRFFEVLQGFNGQLENTTVHVTVETTRGDVSELQQELNDFIEFLKGLNIDNRGVSAIIDELIAEAYKFVYLLNFS